MANYRYTDKKTIIADYLMAGQTGLKWHSTDSKEAYLKNVSKLDPIYLNKTIKYNFNSQGYRTAELSTYNDDQFLLAMGCSYTSGVGLAQEDIWCEVLGRHLDLPVMNLGAEGTGLDFVYANSLLYINGDYPKPKMVVIQHSQASRKLQVNYHNHDTGPAIEVNIGYKELDNPEEYMTQLNRQGDYTNLFWLGIYTDQITKIWNSIGVPVLHWTFPQDGENHFSDYAVSVLPDNHPNTWGEDYDINKIRNITARDYTHDGIERHQYVADTLKLMADDLLASGKLNQPCTEVQISHADYDHTVLPNSGPINNPTVTDPEQIAKQQLLSDRKRSNIIYN